MATCSVAEIALELAPWHQLQGLLDASYPRPPRDVFERVVAASHERQRLWLASDVFYRYCSRAALRALCSEGDALGADTLFRFDGPEPVRVVGHPAYGVSGRAHLRDVFSYGAHLGWSPIWCPFVGQAAATWYDVFARHPSHETWERWVDELLMPDLESLTH